MAQIIKTNFMVDFIYSNIECQTLGQKEKKH